MFSKPATVDLLITAGHTNLVKSDSTSTISAKLISHEYYLPRKFPNPVDPHQGKKSGSEVWQTLGGTGEKVTVSPSLIIGHVGLG